MNTRLDRHILLTFLLVLSLFTRPLYAQSDLEGLFLTWDKDPTSTMIVDWHNRNETLDSVWVRSKDKQGEWQAYKSYTLPFPYSEKIIHRVYLEGLSAGTAYEFKIEGSDAVYYFKTMPQSISKKPLKIAFGGDTMHDIKYLNKTNDQVVKHDPDFIIIGGDFAYANGVAKNVNRWDDWFKGWQRLIRPDGRVVPTVVGIGNHEVKGHFIDRKKITEFTDKIRSYHAPYFYGLFAFPGQPGYGRLDFSNYLRLIILDTDHTNPIDGVQTQWLEQQLQGGNQFTHTLPVYHVPAYPSVRKYTDATATRVRTHWVPLFEQYNIKLALENHDHAYKRTKPIRNGAVDKTGVTYVGDGSWGTKPREVHDAAKTWYLDNSKSIQQFVILELDDKGYKLRMYDNDGNQIDKYDIKK